MPDAPPPSRPPPERPLPECLTRLLTAPGTPIAATGGDPTARAPHPAPRRPSAPNLALRGTLWWAALYNIAGFAILYWLWTTMRVP